MVGHCHVSFFIAWFVAVSACQQETRKSARKSIIARPLSSLFLHPCLSVKKKVKNDKGDIRSAPRGCISALVGIERSNERISKSKVTVPGRIKQRGTFGLSRLDGCKISKHQKNKIRVR